MTRLLRSYQLLENTVFVAAQNGQTVREISLAQTRLNRVAKLRSPDKEAIFVADSLAELLNSKRAA